MNELSYREILASQENRQVAVAALCGYVGLGIAPLAIIVAARNGLGGFGPAGIVGAAFTLGAAVLGPLRGRLVDRRGLRGGLIPQIAFHAGALIVLGLAISSSGAAAAVLMAAIAGATTPPLMATVRTIWSRLAEPDGWFQRAYAIESVLQETGFVLGPLLAGAMIAVASASGALVLAAVLFALCGWALVRVKNGEEGVAAEAGHEPWGAMRHPGVWLLVAISMPIGLCVGSLEVAVPAFAESRGTIAQAGVLFATISIGSILGGLWYGAHRWPGSVGMRLFCLFVLLAVVLAPVATFDTVPALGLVLFFVGVFLAPISVVLYMALDFVVPRAVATEAFTWITAAELCGSAAGLAGGGRLIEHGGGVDAALLVAPLAVAGAALITLFATRRLQAVERGNTIF
jgi:predicted MFS family arabinose efflux permease